MSAHPRHRELLRRWEQGERPKFVCFWGGERRGPGIGPECLSQWNSAAFEVEGQRYTTAEHWMMAEKARLFGDAASLERILAAPSPGAAKALGRAVVGFDTARWEQHRCDIVTRGNLHRFEQNEAERAFLRRTGEMILVEASPQDLVWGVGHAAEDPRATDPPSWRGANLLGFCLMDVREQLRVGS